MCWNDGITQQLGVHTASNVYVMHWHPYLILCLVVLVGQADECQLILDAYKRLA